AGFTAQEKQRGCHQHGGKDDPRAREACHGHFPHSMPVGSSITGGVMVGDASAYSVVLHSPAAAAQFLAKVQGELLVFWIVVLPLAEVMTAVSPGWVSCTHWKFVLQTLAPPSCSVTTVRPRCDRMSRMVPRMPMVASPVVIL